MPKGDNTRKLTDAEMRFIRDVGRLVTQTGLAVMFDISRQRVHQIVKRYSAQSTK